ncbi:hypothetical protein HF086_009771 [Spodoptera exigua]|uniref:Dynein associated protein domain-containing protein n=1 Tax=Spodoptera exigua TaxID=7107 RepID=A0A922MBJ1_SPOEX|nr:hypothetical protein HF086_009771 [Spodoptera exigua]
MKITKSIRKSGEFSSVPARLESVRYGDNSSSRTSLASSRQSLTSYASPTTERAASPEQKRASFVETGFVETLTPQYTPGQSITSPQPASSSMEDKIANIQAQQEITNLKAEVEDLKEKLETIKVRRAEDREKLRELERVRLQLDQANEFKAKIMESQAQLQRDLQRAKQEVREAQEALETHNDETAELQEAAEMAALDKEMAEERAEALQMELEQCREKLEEATLDLQLMKAEMEAGGNIQHPYAEGGATGYEMRQLQQQNVRLRDTLVRLRDLSAHDKHEMQKMHKDLEQYKSEIAELSRTKEKLSLRVDELEAQVADLREQVDAALGAEEMVEQLAEKKMALEDQVEQLKQDVSELEALQEVHEQLVESNRELEMDLREELEMAHANTREAIREREAALETIMDRDSTILKFRELVQKMTEQYNETRAQLESKQGSPAPSEQESTPEPVSRTSPPMDLGSLVHASRASTRSIDLQLRALDLTQARARADMLAACLPDHFMATSGDHDAILLILLLQRLNTKADIILGQIRENQIVILFFQVKVPIKKSVLRQALHKPKVLGVERVWTYLTAMWGALGLGVVTEAQVAREPLLHACSALDALARALHADASALTHILQQSDRQQELGVLHEAVCASSATLQQQLKSVRRRLPPGVKLHAVPLDPQPIPPVVIRAQLVKKQLEETKSLTIKLENKEADIRELRKALKMTIRRELGERKLKEKEFEETMDHLQQDIDSLETERGALREKLKLYAKRGGTHHEETPVKVTAGIAAGEVNEALQHQIKVLSWTVERERAARVSACRKAERAALRALRPLEHPASPAATARRHAAAQLERDLAKLQTVSIFNTDFGNERFYEEKKFHFHTLKMNKPVYCRVYFF